MDVNISLVCVLISGSFTKEDLAAAVVKNSLGNLVQFIVLSAQNESIQTVYLCGAMLDHPYAQRCLANAFLELVSYIFLSYNFITFIH